MKKNSFLINIIILSIILIITFIVKYQYDIQNTNITLKVVTILGMCTNIYYIISGYLIKKEIKSPYILFQVFCLLFLYGQLFCREIVDYRVEEISDLSRLVSNDSMVQACFLIIFCQIGLHMGFLLYLLVKNNSSSNLNKIDDIDIQLKTLKKLGIILMVISIVPTLYSFYRDFTIASSKGYFGLIENNKSYGIMTIFDKIVPFFQLSIMLLMVGNRKNKKISLIILYLSIIFYGIQVFFGNRGIPLIAIITIIWIYDIAVNKVNKKIIAIILIAIIPVSTVINVIRQVRNDYGIREWIDNLDDRILDNLENNNPVFETLYEIGVTIYPIAYTIDAIPQKYPFKYGKSYILSILSVAMVNTSNSKSSLTYDMNVATQIAKDAGSPFGGSFIQEAYANFGWYSPIFMILLGIALEYLDTKIKHTNDLINLVLIAYFLNTILWTVRNVIITLPREVIWYILPTYILYKIVYSFNYNKSKKLDFN